MTPNATNDNVTNDDGVIEGPDLNKSKTPFDKKLYRQVLLPNGLRAVLISDTVAMTQSYNTGGILPEDGDDDADDFSDDDYMKEEDMEEMWKMLRHQDEDEAREDDK